MYVVKKNNSRAYNFLFHVQTVQYDSYLSSPMVEFLLQRSTQSHRIAHSLFWHLRLVLATNVRFRDRYDPVLQALKTLCGEQQQQEFNNQVKNLSPSFMG